MTKQMVAFRSLRTRLKTSHFILYGAKVAVCSEHINAAWAEIYIFECYTPAGASSNQ